MSKVQQVSNGMSAATAASYWNEAVRSGYMDVDDFAAAAFKDEDDMASNSAKAVASQQSIKAYVDNAIQNRVVTRSYSFAQSPSGVHYLGGYYYAPAADANLTNASTTQTLGTANIAYGAYAFVVAGGAGTTDGSDLVLTITGTSVEFDGTRTGSDSEVIVADCTAAATDQYFQSTKRWVGQITYALSSTGGATFGFDFNYGYVFMEDFNNVDFYVTGFHISGDCGASDTGFDVELLHHSATGWTYSSAAFVPGGTVICSMATDYAPENDLTAGQYFGYGREGISTAIDGSNGDGVLVRITQGANNTVSHADIHIRAQLAQGTIT